MQTLLSDILFTTIISFSIMLLSYLTSVKLSFYSLVDAVWAFSFTLISLFILPDFSKQHLLFMLMMGVWSLRLSLHLGVRLYRHYPFEDKRYELLKIKWGKSSRKNMFLLFMVQALSVIFLMIPALLVFRYAFSINQDFDALQIFGFLIFVVGVSGEALADSQLKKFKKNHSQNGHAVCQEGLWRYSRHPNYFFEWIVWCGLAVFALSVPWGWMALTSPVVMLWLLLRVTGVPLLEELSLKSRGKYFEEYQKTTSVFFPKLPKELLSHVSS